MTVRRGSRGQVLIIAVLVLFAVASLAALLAAIVGAQIVQVSRYADVMELTKAAESILAIANEQLTYGWKGADWRPPTTYQVGKVLVGITVNYGPVPPALGGTVQDRYMRISIAAKFPDDPFLRYSTLAFKPLLLTDYARFITDRYELRQPAALGVGGVELGGLPRVDSTKAGAYEFTINGPIRSNTDLEWYGRSQVNLFTPNFADWYTLGLFRDDRIEVAGTMRPAMRPGQPDLTVHDEPSVDANRLGLSVDGVMRSQNVFMPNTALEQNLYATGFADETFAGSQTVTNTWRVLADLPRYQAMFPADRDHPELSTVLSVPRVQPPRLDAVHPELHTNRYLILTRDSGKWAQVSIGAGTTLVNTGATGWGWTNAAGGIYIDNVEDIQYAHDLDKLRRNWMGGYSEVAADGRSKDMLNAPPNWWDRTGRYYTPPGVEIILHGEAPCPYVEIVRHTVRHHPDDTGTAQIPYYWKDAVGNYVANGEPLTFKAEPGECARPTGSPPLGVFSNTARFPFPPNGVIYAEGNVRIRGVMPQNWNDPSNPPAGYLGTTFDTGKTPAANRYYDLQVVSGGTIYIEGDLLSATAAHLYGSDIATDATKVATYDRDRAARLALIARDNVCVNTTALLPRPTSLLTPEAADSESNILNDGQPVYPASEDKGYPPYMLFRGKATPANDASLGNSLTPAVPTVPTEVVSGEERPAGASFTYWNVRLQSPVLKPPELRLLIGHSGWYLDQTKVGDGGPAIQPPDDEPYRQAQVFVERFLKDMTTPWNWDEDQPQYTFRFPGTGQPDRDASDHWYTEMDRTKPFDADTTSGLPNCDYAEFLPSDKQAMVIDSGRWTEGSAQQTLAFKPWVKAVRHDEDPPNEQWVWDVQPDQLGYILGPVAVAPPRWKADTAQEPQDPLPVEIDALVYAQNGSWFILPGPWFNEDPDEVYDSEPGALYPAYHEPLNIALRFYGAISENMPAPIGDVTDWTSKWAGPYGARNGFLTYTYDPVLRWYRDTAYRPVFPNFLLTPDLIVWGERVAGATGAGT